MFFNEENLIKVFNTYNPWWRTKEIPAEFKKPVKRRAFYQIEEILNHQDIRRFVLLSGARRVGKTTALYQEIAALLEKGVNNKNILYISFDNPLLKFYSLNDVIEVFKKNIAYDDYIYLFLDEIQYSQEWNTWLKVLYDTDLKVNVVATGSASPLVEKGIAESGTGRWVTITIPTLSFYEYCLLKESYIKDYNFPKVTGLKELNEKEMHDLLNVLSPLQREFNRYIVVGGFPELVLSNDDIYAQRILREDIVDKVLKRDIPELYNVRNITTLEKVFLYLCFNSSNIINYSKMCQVLDNASLQTIQDYIRYLESANLIYINEPIYSSGSTVLKSRPKIYIVDAAIRNAVLMQDDVLTNNTELGYVVETAVYRQVRTFYTKAQIGYYRDKKKDDREIDIVVKGINKNQYIEIKYREKPEVDSQNPIYELPEKEDDIFIITKKDTDYEIVNCLNGKRIVKIPAYAYLYLLGKEEYEKI